MEPFNNYVKVHLTTHPASSWLSATCSCTQKKDRRSIFLPLLLALDAKANQVNDTVVPPLSCQVMMVRSRNSGATIRI